MHVVQSFQLLKNYENHDPRERTAAELLKNATEHEKKLIDAALRSYRNGKPDGAKAIDTWLENASSKGILCICLTFSNEIESP